MLQEVEYDDNNGSLDKKSISSESSSSDTSSSSETPTITAASVRYNFDTGAADADTTLTNITTTLHADGATSDTEDGIATISVTTDTVTVLTSSREDVSTTTQSTEDSDPVLRSARFNETTLLANKQASRLSARLGLNHHIDSVVVRQKARSKVVSQGELYNEIGKLVSAEDAEESTIEDDAFKSPSYYKSRSASEETVLAVEDNNEVGEIQSTVKVNEDNASSCATDVDANLSDDMEVSRSDDHTHSILYRICCCGLKRKTR